MNFQMDSGSAGFAAFTFLAWAIGIVVTVFWMVVGWRAMRAHEQLASSLERLADKERGTP